MPKDYIFNPVTKQLLASFAKNPKGSIFITGGSTADLNSAIDYLLENAYLTDNHRQGYVYNLADYKVEELRQLIMKLHRTKFDQDLPRFIIIKECHNLSPIMQNSLLKSLEEPPIGSHFILTSNQSWQMLPTILSRLQIIKVHKPLKADLFKLWADRDEQLLNQAYWASDGWFNLMADYLNDDSSLIHCEIKSAKEFLALKKTDKLAFFFDKKLGNDSKLEQILEPLINGLWRICRATVLSMAASNQPEKVSLWRDKLIIVNQLKIDFSNKLNHKIIALSLSLKL